MSVIRALTEKDGKDLLDKIKHAIACIREEKTPDMQSIKDIIYDRYKCFLANIDCKDFDSTVKPFAYRLAIINDYRFELMAS